MSRRRTSSYPRSSLFGSAEFVASDQDDRHQSSTTTISNSARSITSSNNMNNNHHNMTAFAIHEDALYAEISHARKRLKHRQVALTDATTSNSADHNYSATAAFWDLWETEIARMSDFLQAQQQNLEASSKAMLTNVEAALQRVIEVEEGDQEVSSSKRSNNSNKQKQETAKATIQMCRSKTDELANACSSLQQFSCHNKETLQEIGTYADEKLGTSCLASLQRRFAAAPWKTGPNSSLIVVLSDIYDVIRAAEQRQALGAGAAEDPRANQWVAPTTFERKTTKYWVQDEQLTDLLLAAVAEAPLLVYGKSGRLTTKKDCLSQRSEGDKLWDQLATPITSVYLDSPKMSLYKERLPRHEGAQLLRARWYGRKPQGDEPIFLELKTHHEKWINTKSLKERVTIREKDMPRFLSFEEWTTKDAERMLLAATPNLTGSNLERDVDRLLRMHQLVFKHGLRPCVRSCYLRAAFQSSKSNALRLTIDRNITIVDESNKLTTTTTKSTNSNWCLSEDAVISNNMTARVPFVVLEVKIAGDSETPAVIQDLQARGIIQEATKFSKYLTGAAAFNMDRVGMLPHWAEHPAFGPIFQRRDNNINNSASNKSKKKDDISESVVTTTTDGKVSDTASLSSSEKPAETTHFFDNHEEPKGTIELAPSFSDEMEEAKTKGRFADVGGLFRRRRRNSSKDSNAPLPVAARKPARVEPKSYFANERTFIQWISASLLLVTISVLLLGIDSEMGSTSEYARKAGVGVCIGAVMIIGYATFIYFRRLRLLSTGSAYGYIDHIGPMVLAVSVCIGVIVLLVHFMGEIEFARAQSAKKVYLHEKPGQCYLHSNRGISKLEYQPSDIVVDEKRRSLLVPSLQRILQHSLDPPLPNRENRVKTLIEIPDSNLEGLTVIGERVFALSEGPKRTELIELAWNEDEELSVVNRWKLSKSEEAEGIAYVPDKTRRSGRLFIDVNHQIHIYNVPAAANVVTDTNEDEDDDDALLVEDTAITDPNSIELERIGSLNNHVLLSGLKDLRISSMFYFEGVAYILHDNEMLVRAWDLDEGDLLAEIPLPRVEGGFSKEWEGLALERREIPEDQKKEDLFEPNYSLRGSATEGTTTKTQLILHLALDTPAQIWSMAVEQGEARGSLILPSCAVSARAYEDLISEQEDEVSR